MTPQREEETRFLNLLRSPLFYAESRDAVKTKFLSDEGRMIYHAIEKLHGKLGLVRAGDYKEGRLGTDDILTVVKRKASGQALASVANVVEALLAHDRDFKTPGAARVLYQEYRNSIMMREVMLIASLQIETQKYDFEVLRGILETERPTEVSVEPADFTTLVSRAVENRSNRIATGFPGVDEALQGGLGVGELMVIGGYGKSGKSAVLVNLALHEMREKRPVLYMTLADLHTLEIEIRLACMISEAPEADVLAHPDWLKDIQAWQQKHGNYIIPIDLTGKTVAPGQIEAIIQRVKTEHPRLRTVIIDRAESMARATNADQLRHRLAKVFTDVRGVAENTKTAIFVDIQTDVKSQWKTLVHWSDAHESKVDVGATLDIWLGIGRKQDDPDVRFFNLAGRRRIGDNNLHRFRFNKDTYQFAPEAMYEGEEV